MSLLIVESPAKGRKIQKFLRDTDITVSSSFGHINGLDTEKLDDMISNNFTPIYKNARDKEETIKKLKTTTYIEPFELNAGEYDSAIAFFVKRGFGRTAAESTAYIILQQAKIDSVTPQEILDKLTYASPAQLSELITIVLNANRYKSSRLGVRQTRTTNDTVSRNIID